MPGTRVKMKWSGEQIKREIARQVEKRLDLVGELIRGEIVRNISVSARANGPSKPGEFPHADTGKLRQSIFWERKDRNTVIIGSTLKYARHLEMGTSYMAPRPFMYRTIADNARRIESILSKDVK